MSAVWSIAKAEMAWLSRSRLAQMSAGIFLLLLALSALTSTVFLSEQFDHRQTHQDEATDIFEDQPDRHPHRMVHYGQYVFRTPPPLASIDPGLDAYGGTSIFLEGHRQNAAMFAGASEGAAMVRFGNLTPAFILQVLAPLLLILIGHSGLTRERESSTLQVLLAQGVKLRSIALGKLTVQLIISAVCVLVLAVAAFTAGPEDTRDSVSATAVVLVYAVYLAIWALAVTSISTMLRRSSSAFLVLAALWMIVTIVVPRVAADVASTAAPLESAFARQMALATSLRALGDSHNPSDPNYVDFQSKVLADYGVETLDELPINIRGLMAVEGERQGAEVLARFSGADQDARVRQQEIIGVAGLLSPVLAIQRASQAIAGTDLAAYHRFLNTAEEHRLAFVQALNMLQATEVDYTLDKLKSIDVQAERATRVSADAWRSLPAFVFEPAASSTRIANAIPSVILLLLWFAGSTGLFLWATGRRNL
ncbi:DUF3526 domain-containing protein [Congregibacter brevis]|uniref:DUF3526 domain-containing protein n=1 Tax=Congregibacter brevis TaxID=3081201 RepID=A0ABZ0I9N8_9GAMM|nr:DUF3526 domain-containing protein [Congregibacter sp. IMCC45268]